MAETDSHLGDEPPNVFQSEFDSEALKPIEPGERLRVVDWCVSRSAYPRGAWLANLARLPPARFTMSKKNSRSADSIAHAFFGGGQSCRLNRVPREIQLFEILSANPGALSP